MIDELLALLVIGDLECERLVPDEAAGASDATQGALLFTVWFNPKFVGLQAFHTLNIEMTLSLGSQNLGLRLKSVTGKIIKFLN